MKFKYSARTKTGELQAGFVEAANRETALNILAGHELYILGMEEAVKAGWLERLLRFFEKVRSVDLAVFTRQFATLLEAKVPLSDSMKNLYEQTSNPILKEAVFEIYSDIEAGLSLSQALERHSNIFSEFYISMIRSAEVSGRMEEVVVFLADYVEKEYGLYLRVRNALIYPVFVIALFVGVVLLMVGVVLPQIEPIFKEAEVDLPVFTKALLVGGNFLVNWWWALLFGLAIVVFVLIDYFQTTEGRALYDELKLKIPVLGKLARKLYVARFAESTSVLLRGAIPVAQAIEISAHTVGNIVYRDVLHEAAEGIRRGELMSQTLAASPYFPPLVSQMVAIGEMTGRLDDLLGRISGYYTREVDNTVSNLVEMIQPALIVVIGLFVGLLFAAILLPIYNLAQAF